jgi:DNA-binding response OmpR family regulator
MTIAPATDAITVLVVEDEFLIREVLAENLANEGFDVHQAAHSAEAIDILQKRWDGIHVLFTDVSMPGDLDGIGLAHHASTHWPDIALLVTSALPQPKDRGLPVGCRFVGKPYRIAHVVMHIRELASR